MQLDVAGGDNPSALWAPPLTQGRLPAPRKCGAGSNIGFFVGLKPSYE